MADRREEVKKAKNAGESIIANKFASDKDDMYSLSYDEAKKKYGVKNGANTYFMSKDQFENQKANHIASKPEEPKPQVEAPKSESLIANKFAEPKTKTWSDVKTENGNDPAKIANYLNNNPDYQAGDLTKKGMADMGYKQDSNGKWTIDQVLDGIEEITAQDANVDKAVNTMTNPETGEVDEEKANNAINSYEKALVELGAATYDEDGNFVLKPTSKAKGWETWATLLSVGLSVVGIAMGVPVIPINFRAVTGKDARDAQIQALQQQYMNIKADSAGTIDQMNADVGAGQIAQNNADALAAQEKHAQATAAQKDVLSAQTDASKQLIDKQTEADMKKAQQQISSNEKIAMLEMKHAKEMAKLSSDLSTASAKELTAFSKTGWVVDYIKSCKEQGLSNKEIALAMAGLNGVTPTQMGLKNAQSIVGMVTDTANAASGFIPGNQ